MPLATYPRSGLDSPTTLSSLLGSFWTSVYGSGAELEASLRGIGAAYTQAARDFDEALASVAYASIPLRHVEEWTPIAVLESSKSDPAYASLMYSLTSGAVFGSAGLYGAPTSLSSFPVPIAPADAVPMICDATVAPKACLVAGIDYSVDPVAKIAWLSIDPFADPRFSPVQLFDASGNPSDRELVLWAWRAQTDVGLLHRRIGYALGLDLPSTPQGLALAVALVASLVEGTSDLTLRRVFAALYDAPIAGFDGEVVAAIAYDQAGLMVATDRAIYRGPASASPVVSVGQVLLAGDPITDALAFDSLSSGTIPIGLAGIALGPSLLGDSYKTGVAFADALVPLDAAPSPQEA